MGRRPSSTTYAVTGAALLVLLLPGCGGSPTASDVSTTAASSTQQSTTASSTTATGTTTPAKKKNVIAWILGLGPSAPEGPPEFTAYRELQQLHCKKVFARVGELDEPARTLYKGAAHACLAALAGDTTRWPRAEAALQQVTARTDKLNCMDGAALALLDRLVTLHAEHPTRRFKMASDTKSTAPPCPAIDAITPDRGPKGTAVRITGRHLSDLVVVGVRVIDSLGNSDPVENWEAVDGALEFTLLEAPQSDASATVCIVVRARPDWVAAGTTFTFESADTEPPKSFDCPPPGEG
ncbi:MAG: IPT/TIG domain-containing protein [Sporichthyaceae bacterium]